MSSPDPVQSSSELLAHLTSPKGALVRQRLVLVMDPETGKITQEASKTRRTIAKFYC
jgi:hypothetical protein